jgi:hypothetical protein
VVTDDLAAQLQAQGVALLRDVFITGSLTILREAARRCFEAEGARPVNYKFNPFSHSVLLSALMDFGCSLEDLTAPLSTPGVGELFSRAMGREWTCNMEQSWVRKKFTPLQAPSRDYCPQGWHQDGGLGVHFPLNPGPAGPMTELLTCWIPLNPCGKDSPGLEFVRRRQESLLHFTELNDKALRERFGAEEFWTPELEFGDGVIFLNSVLHRTYALPEMPRNRLSVEYRIFPALTTKGLPQRESFCPT